MKVNSREFFLEFFLKKINILKKFPFHIFVIVLIIIFFTLSLNFQNITNKKFLYWVSPLENVLQRLNPIDSTNSVLNLSASLNKEGSFIRNGLIWDIFTVAPKTQNKYLFVTSKKGGSIKLSLNPGQYLVYAIFGKAFVKKLINIKPKKNHSVKVNLNAGALKLNAVIPNGKINKKKVRFSIYIPINKEKLSLVLSNVKPENTIGLNAGLYRITSYYGDENSIINSDIYVESGKIIEATIQHYASQITLKLVKEKGGSALTNIEWTILDKNKKIIFNKINSFPNAILSEGNYIIIAKYQGKIYQKNISILSNKDQEIDLLITSNKN